MNLAQIKKVLFEEEKIYLEGARRELQEELDLMEKLLPNEKIKCEYLWKPVYTEYRRRGYRLRKDESLQ